jgi:thymidylate kinase
LRSDLASDRLAASLVLGREPEVAAGRSDSKAVDPEAILRVLEKNKVPIGWLKDERIAAMTPIVESPAFEEARKREQARLTSQRGGYAKIVQAFSNRGFGGVLIKPVDLAPSFPVTSDNLDLFIEPGRMSLAKAVLRNEGLVEIRHVEERGKYLFRRFRGGEEALAIHLHSDVAWDGVVFVDRESLWSRRRHSVTDELVTLPSPEDSVLINLAHAFYENKQIKLSDLVKIEFGLDSPGFDWDYVRWMAWRRGWLFGLNSALTVTDHLYELLQGHHLLDERVLQQVKSEMGHSPTASRFLEAKTLRPEPELPYSIPFSLSKAYWYVKMLRDRETGAEHKSKDLVITSLRGFQRKFQRDKRSQPSMLISLSGIDGSGKTAQAEALIKALETAEVKTTYVWTRGSSSRLLGAAKDLLAPLLLRKPGGERERSVLDQKRHRAKLVSNPILRTIYPYITFLELAWQYVGKVRLPLWRKRVVVADRYIADAIADLGADLDHPSPHRLFASRMLRALAPRPDVAFLLEIPADVSYERKDDEPRLDELVARARGYRAMAGEMGLQRVDARRDFETVCDDIVHDVLRKYCDRHWTLVNALFLSNPSRLKTAENELPTTVA